MLAATRAVPDVLVFIAAAAIILGGAVGVVASRNPVHSALSLIATLLGVALAFLAQQANFLAAAQVIVYAGAIVILFLFVIMYLGVDRQEDIRTEPLIGHRPLAITAIVFLVGGLIALMAAGGWVSGASSVVAATNPNDDVGVLGTTVFTTYLMAFEATSLLLVIAVVGAVLLARRERAARVADSAPAPNEDDPAIGTDATGSDNPPTRDEALSAGAESPER